MVETASLKMSDKVCTDKQCGIALHQGPISSRHRNEGSVRGAECYTECRFYAPPFMSEWPLVVVGGWGGGGGGVLRSSL